MHNITFYVNKILVFHSRLIYTFLYFTYKMRTGGVYIQDRGLSRWDTCAAQAVIEASEGGGGIMCRLDMFIHDKSIRSYKYLPTPINLDFVPGLSLLTAYNSRVEMVKGQERKAMLASEVLPYSNLCGLFALDSSVRAKLFPIHIGIISACKLSPPVYD